MTKLNSTKKRRRSSSVSSKTNGFEEKDEDKGSRSNDNWTEEFLQNLRNSKNHLVEWRENFTQRVKSCEEFQTQLADVLKMIGELYRDAEEDWDGRVQDFGEFLHEQLSEMMSVPQQPQEKICLDQSSSLSSSEEPVPELPDVEDEKTTRLKEAELDKDIQKQLNDFLQAHQQHQRLKNDRDKYAQFEASVNTLNKTVHDIVTNDVMRIHAKMKELEDHKMKMEKLLTKSEDLTKELRGYVGGSAETLKPSGEEDQEEVDIRIRDPEDSASLHNSLKHPCSTDDRDPNLTDGTTEEDSGEVDLETESVKILKKPQKTQQLRLGAKVLVGGSAINQNAGQRKAHKL